MPLSLLALSCLLLSISFTSATPVGGHVDRREKNVNGHELRQWILDGLVRFSQDSLGCTTRATQESESLTLQQLRDSILVRWVGERIRAVYYPAQTNQQSTNTNNQQPIPSRPSLTSPWVMLDHRRAVAGAWTDSVHAIIKMKIFADNEYLDTTPAPGISSLGSAWVAFRNGGRNPVVLFNAAQTRIRVQGQCLYVSELLLGTATIPPNEPGSSNSNSNSNRRNVRGGRRT